MKSNAKSPKTTEFKLLSKEKVINNSRTLMKMKILN